MRGGKNPELTARLVAAYEATGENQKEAAERIEVSQGTLSTWLKGDAYPDGLSFCRIPDGWGVDGHWLTTGQGIARLMEGGESPAQLFVLGARAVLQDLAMKHHEIQERWQRELQGQSVDRTRERVEAVKRASPQGKKKGRRRA